MPSSGTQANTLEGEVEDYLAAVSILPWLEKPVSFSERETSECGITAYMQVGCTCLYNTDDPIQLSKNLTPSGIGPPPSVPELYLSHLDSSRLCTCHFEIRSTCHV